MIRVRVVRQFRRAWSEETTGYAHKDVALVIPPSHGNYIAVDETMRLYRVDRVIITRSEVEVWLDTEPDADMRSAISDGWMSSTREIRNAVTSST